jgi:hypothetical protein
MENLKERLEDSEETEEDFITAYEIREPLANELTHSCVCNRDIKGSQGKNCTLFTNYINK